MGRPSTRRSKTTATYYDHRTFIISTEVLSVLHDAGRPVGAASRVAPLTSREEPCPGHGHVMDVGALAESGDRRSGAKQRRAYSPPVAGSIDEGTNDG